MRFWDYFFFGFIPFFTSHSFYFGITTRSLLLIELDIIGNPVSIHHHLYSDLVSFIYSKGLTQDKLLLSFEGMEPIDLRVSWVMRNQSESIVSIINSREFKVLQEHSLEKKNKSSTTRKKVVNEKKVEKRFQDRLSPALIAGLGYYLKPMDLVQTAFLT